MSSDTFPDNQLSKNCKDKHLVPVQIALLLNKVPSDKAKCIEDMLKT